MKKPTYYLWHNNFSTDEEYKHTKKALTAYGFRVVTFFDGANEKNIHNGLKALIKNHYTEFPSYGDVL